jgi:hypothetical protein
VECGSFLQAAPVTRGEEIPVEQVVVNLTTLTVEKVNWPGYPSLGKSGGYDVVQVMTYKHTAGWVRLVPVLSGAPNEILFSDQIIFSLTSVIAMLN